MTKPRSLPPIPILEDFPVEQLYEYAETFLAACGTRRRWTVALEVYPEPGRKPAGVKWFVLVSLRPKVRQLFTMIDAALDREVVIPDAQKRLETGTLKALFLTMTKQGESVWFYPLFRRGAVVFVRKPAGHPSLKRILSHNRAAANPPVKLTRMSVVTRDRGASGARELVRAALHFQMADAKAFRRAPR